MNGIFSSPGYPSNYFGMGKRYFVITVPGTYHISLSLTGNIRNGSLIVKRGLGENDGIIQTLRGTFSKINIITTYSKISIIFYSKAFVTNYFQAKYSSRKGNEIN